MRVFSFLAVRIGDQSSHIIKRGMNAHVAKPIDVWEVIRLLVKFLK